MKITDGFSDEVQNEVDGLETFIVDNNKWQVNGETLYKLIFKTYWNESGHKLLECLNWLNRCRLYYGEESMTFVF